MCWSDCSRLEGQSTDSGDRRWLVTRPKTQGRRHGNKTCIWGRTWRGHRLHHSWIVIVIALATAATATPSSKYHCLCCFKLVFKHHLSLPYCPQLLHINTKTSIVCVVTPSLFYRTWHNSTCTCSHPILIAVTDLIVVHSITLITTLMCGHVHSKIKVMESACDRSLARDTIPSTQFTSLLISKVQCRNRLFYIMSICQDVHFVAIREVAIHSGPISTKRSHHFLSLSRLEPAAKLSAYHTCLAISFNLFISGWVPSHG